MQLLDILQQKGFVRNFHQRSFVGSRQILAGILVDNLLNSERNRLFSEDNRPNFVDIPEAVVVVDCTAKAK